MSERMGIWGWLLLLLGAPALATVAQFTIFRKDLGPEYHDWIFIAVAALVGGFIGSVLYGSALDWGPVIDGLAIIPALIGAVTLSVIVEIVYRAFIYPRQFRA